MMKSERHVIDCSMLTMIHSIHSILCYVMMLTPTYQQHIKWLDHYCLLLSLYLIVQTHIDAQCHFYDHSLLCSVLLDYYNNYLHCIHLVCHHLRLTLHTGYDLLSMLVSVDLLKASLMHTTVRHLDQDEQ